jgi:ATP-dependent helicase/nuclease subunit B
VRSRWLWRLEMLTKGADSEATRVEIERRSPALEIARVLDAPADPRPAYARRPAPTPPVDRRPRELPVTGVERWVRDPYAVYAQRILGLRVMDRPGASAEALARGDAVHAALERVVKTWPAEIPDDCAVEIERFLHEAMTDRGFDAAAMARERPLARNCARWLADFERERRARGATLLIEVEGRMTIPSLGGDFTVTARADRIELGADGAAVIDFKTGSTPTAKQVRQGFAPQLTLTAAILADGGFAPHAPPTEATELSYVSVVGRKVPGKVVEVSRPTKADPAGAAEMAQTALEGLAWRIDEFDNPSTPYISWAAPQFMGSFGGNYDHLARLWEWHVAGADEEAEA